MKITLEKLNIFNKYGGDATEFRNMASTAEKSLFDEETWVMLYDLVENLELIEKGLTSAEFKNRILDQLKLAADKEAYTLIVKKIKGVK